MKNLLIIIISILPHFAMSQDTIEVRGTAVVKIVPDLIYLRIQVSEKQKNRVDLELKERRMLDKLKNIGIESKDIAIKDLASNFRYTLFSTDNIVLSKEYVVLVHDVKTANKIVSELETLEISNITVDRLDHSKISEFKRECSIKAIVAAKEKAESLTHAIGQSIGNALLIQEVENAPVRSRETANYAYKAEKMTSEDWYVTALDFDEIRLECSVFVRFALKSVSSN